MGRTNVNNLGSKESDFELLSSYTYDANGNTLSDASGKSYTWDFENRLTQAVVPGSNGGTTTFKYDPFGRRIQKSGPLGTTNYLYDGMNGASNVIEEVDNGGNVLARYAQSPTIDQPVAEFRSGTASYYQRDGLGSMTSLTNGGGTASETYVFDSFGRQTASTGTVVNPLQYTGRELDSETSLYSNRARYYDPTVGRFLSEDPLGFVGSRFNFYAYVGNNAANLIDPLGLTNCVVTPTMGTVCTDWGPGLNWMEPKSPQPPPMPNMTPVPLIPPRKCDRGDNQCGAAYAETVIGGAATLGGIAFSWYVMPKLFEEGVLEGAEAIGHGIPGVPIAPGPIMYWDGLMNIAAHCPLFVDRFFD